MKTIFTLIILIASMKSTPKLLCSCMPVAIVRILGSKMISVGSKPALSIKSLYDLVQISTFLAQSAA